MLPRMHGADWLNIVIPSNINTWFKLVHAAKWLAEFGKNYKIWLNNDVVQMESLTSKCGNNAQLTALLKNVILEHAGVKSENETCNHNDKANIVIVGTSGIGESTLRDW